MFSHQRRLPHYYPPDAILFLTWRLFGSLRSDARVSAPQEHPHAGAAFVRSDRLLDRASGGPVWLSDARVARLVADTLERGEVQYRMYERFAWVIMPNHVHLVLRPSQELPRVMRWIKGSTARAANLLLGRTGSPFWQYESYDHCIRDTNELNRVIRYVERNPVAAGLASAIDDWPWSSAGRTPGP
jgi:REP element-mobilizing transposase RayT